MNKIKLVVFDMAGTTVRDDHEVESCIFGAAEATGLEVSWDRVHEMNGLPKKQVFEMLWAEAIGADHPDFESNVETSFSVFRKILEDFYRTEPVSPTEGAVETITWLRSQGIKVALNTGFYREVANIILKRLQWDQGLDKHYLGGPESFIDLSVTPTETNERGRPNPDMIQYAMQKLGIVDPTEVIKIGDAPVDVEEGKAAGCLLTLAVLNGVHTREELEAASPDGLLESTGELRFFLEERGLN
ncbi:MAG: HAD family hydrolase [Saprospirales bacterium]|nr:HAD family hydrolase [Saprospirales bacterium]